MTTTNKFAEDYSNDELVACFLARDFEDRMTIGIGAGLPVARAAVYLAAFTRCPNLIVRMGESKTNVLNVGPVGPFEFETDIRSARWAECYYNDQDIAASETRKLVERGCFFVGGIQVDMYGNCNLIGIGDDYKRLKFRGPGGIGAPTMSSQAKHYYIMLTRHDTRTFVEHCDYISHIGWNNGEEDSRIKLGLPGGGPKYVITPIAIMDFEEKTKRMRLKFVHPGISIEEVIENTGFELIIPDKQVQNTPLPTQQEIEYIRSKIDTKGDLRK